MAVNNTHEDYKEMCGKWKRCRDASEGQDAVHKAGTEYLPMLADQSSAEYHAYKTRASFYNATWRTISGLQGMLFRKPPVVEVAEVVKPMLEDVSLCGENLHMFALEVLEEALTVGRVGIFVDYPTIDPIHNTQADSKLLGLRPIMKQYCTESIINWKESVIGNTCILSMVVLSEEVAIPGKDEFDIAEGTQYRVLDLTLMEKEDGTKETVYRVRVFTIDPKTGLDVLVSTAYPMIKGKYLSTIPFFVVGTDCVEIDPDTPPLIDLVDINLSHYRTNADYEHGCHFTGLPTPVISGYTPEKEGQSFGIGSMTAWVFPRPDARATYLEFTGQGLKALESNLTRKETQMTVLGARMLESKPSNGDSKGDAAVNMGGEQSILAALSQAASIGIERALTAFSKFAGSDQPVKFRLNKDFFPMPMSALNLTALVASWQNGAISYQTLFDNLQRGEIVDIDQTVEAELAGMDQHKPEIPGGTKVNQSATTGSHETTLAGSSGNNPTQRQLQTPPKA
jgi:hypothetical protein